MREIRAEARITTEGAEDTEAARETHTSRVIPRSQRATPDRPGGGNLLFPLWIAKSVIAFGYT